MIMILTIDGLPHQIDSTDPELLSKWLIEIFGRLPKIYESTLIEFQVRPSFTYTFPDTADRWTPDWLADSRIIAQRHVIHAPEDVPAVLAEQLAEARRLKANLGP